MQEMETKDTLPKDALEDASLDSVTGGSMLNYMLDEVTNRRVVSYYYEEERFEGKSRYHLTRQLEAGGRVRNAGNLSPSEFETLKTACSDHGVKVYSEAVLRG